MMYIITLLVYNADDVSDWMKDTELAKLEGVLAKIVGEDRFYNGSDGAEQVHHEEQLYHPIASAIYGPVNQAAEVLGLPLKYTMTRGMSMSSNVVDHAVVANNHQLITVLPNMLTSAFSSSVLVAL